MTDNTTVNRWMDLSAIFTRFDLNVQQVGNIARYYCRYVSADPIEFEIKGETIFKVGKGKLARYRVISNPHSL